VSKRVPVGSICFGGKFSRGMVYRAESTGAGEINGRSSGKMSGNVSGGTIKRHACRSKRTLQEGKVRRKTGNCREKNRLVTKGG